MRKVLISIFAVVFVLLCFASCDSLKHEHITDDKWSHNEHSHWKNITCSWNWCQFDIVTEEHKDDDGNLLCDVCGFEMSVPSWDVTEWQHSETHHWWVPETTEAGVVYGFGEHVDEDKNNFCDVCNYPLIHLNLDINIEWQYGPTHHWWVPETAEDGVSVPGVVYGYGEHIDEDKDNYCDVCKCLVLVKIPGIDIEWGYNETHHWWQVNDDIFHVEPLLLYGEHKDEDGDGYCDVCKYHPGIMIDPPHILSFHFHTLPGVEWLETLKADDVAEIRMISQAYGVAPGCFRYISSSTESAPIARILEEYLHLVAIPHTGEIDLAPGNTETVVEFVLKNGTKKSFSFNDKFYIFNGEYFEVTNIPTFHDVPEFTMHYGFVSYEPMSWVIAYSDGNAEVLRPVCTIPMDALEFTILNDVVFPTVPTDYPYYVGTEFGNLVFLDNSIFYVSGGDGTYYRLVGKNLDELIADATAQEYSLVMNDAEWLWENLNPTYKAGETVSVKIKIAYDLGYLLFVNGKRVMPENTSVTDYWEFIFTMPACDTVIDFRTYDGFLPNQNYAVLYEAFWEQNLNADYVSIRHYYGEYSSGAIVAMIDWADYTEALWNEKVGNTVIRYNNGNHILVLYEGKFYNLRAAYEYGFITDEDLSAISNLHKEFYPFLYYVYE